MVQASAKPDKLKELNEVGNCKTCYTVFGRKSGRSRRHHARFHEGWPDVLALFASIPDLVLNHVRGMKGELQKC